MIRGEAPCRLSDGRTLTMKVNLTTLARAAVQTGVPAGELFGVLRDRADPRQMTVALAMVEQALKRNHPEFDEDAVGDLMLTDEDVLATALKAAVEGAFGPAAEDKEGANPPRPTRGTGTSSRRRGPKRA